MRISCHLVRNETGRYKKYLELRDCLFCESFVIGSVRSNRFWSSRHFSHFGSAKIDHFHYDVTRAKVSGSCSKDRAQCRAIAGSA